MRGSCGLPEGCGVGPVRPARRCAEASHGRGNACRSPRPKRQGAKCAQSARLVGASSAADASCAASSVTAVTSAAPRRLAVTWSNQVSVVRSSCRASRSSWVSGAPAPGARGAAAGLRGWRRRGRWRRRSPGSAGPASRGARCSGRSRRRRSRQRCRHCRRARPGSSTATETSSASTGTVLVRPQVWQVMETNVAVGMAGSFRLASPSARVLSRACRCVARIAGSRTASGQRADLPDRQPDASPPAAAAVAASRPGRCAGATTHPGGAVSSCPAPHQPQP